MRPTVLRTPEMASLQVEVEKERLPGVRAAERDLDKIELKKASKDKNRRDQQGQANPAANPKAPGERDAQGYLIIPE